MYSQIYKNILYPLYETVLMRRNTGVYLKKLNETQWYSGRQLRQQQFEKLKLLVSHAYVNVPYYKEIFDKSKLAPSDIKSFEDFQKLPFLTKSDIRNNEDKLLAQNYKDKKVFNTATGGSSGTPLRLKLDHDNYEWRQAAVKRVYGWTGYADGEKTVFIWGGSIGKENGIRKVKHDIDEWLKRHKIYNTFYLNKENIPDYLRKISMYRPKFIVGYTTPLYNFARYITENGKLGWKPVSIIAAAEKLYPYQRKMIETAFGCPVFETYGCREVTSIAGECEFRDGMHINMENIYLEIVKGCVAAEPGELGEIVVTDLTNYCMPLIRYKNEDIGSLSAKTCGCGRGLCLLEKVEGRVLDTIQTTDGRMVPGEFFPHLMKEFEEVEKFQIYQENLDNLRIDIIKRKDFSADSLGLMKSEISKVMGERIGIDLRFVDNIPLSRSGKHRVVISKVPVNFWNGSR